ncbi:hypothetical protein H2198_009229 [Neophaeococcomyces mojaviensis]|uniref:Uncharacterized protein n=1 Tax=Neophaeococcomyces mojaviensis TaxID=3383035 RepID=A0ACC2ZV24_9EURO|nr:hypothetical protein H2198_009229 [Knufia sp. JES_112]
MRVLKTRGSDKDGWVPQLCDHQGQPYAILSHRWLSRPHHEVLFTDIEVIDNGEDQNTTIDTEVDVDVVKNAQYTGKSPGSKPGFKKLQGAARQALEDGYYYIWVDTCCIDKNSSAELSEAINSMWTWYSTSSVCYAYLADVPSGTHDMSPEWQDSTFAKSRWWERGWTLQELLAPKKVLFFSSEWNLIGEKAFLDAVVSKITGIDSNAINGCRLSESFSIAQRMSWASSRKTTRVEDLAYCLLGLFSVNMPLLYGEGEKAFVRLQQEIMKDSDDETLFAWRDPLLQPETYNGLLASRPSAFAASSQVLRYQDAEHREPYSMSNKGLAVKLPLTQEADGLFTARLHCPNPETGDSCLCIYLKKISTTNEHYARVKGHEWAKVNASDRGSPAESKAIFVRQSFDQRPAYKPLGESFGSIRLLQVLAHESTSTVKCKLVDGNMYTSRYKAISYDWGKTNKTDEVLLNEERICVKRNLFQFLQKAQQDYTDELLWVDAICIQHQSSLERDQQAEHVSRIFKHATVTLVLLGEDMKTPRFLLELTDTGTIFGNGIKTEAELHDVVQYYARRGRNHWPRHQSQSQLLSLMLSAMIPYRKEWLERARKSAKVKIDDDTVTVINNFFIEFASQRIWTQGSPVHEFHLSETIVFVFNTVRIRLEELLRAYAWVEAPVELYCNHMSRDLLYGSQFFRRFQTRMESNKQP